MAKFIITVKNKSRISLAKLVTIITFEVTPFGGSLLLAFTCEILSLLSGGLLLWEVYGRVRLSEKVVKDGDRLACVAGVERGRGRGNLGRR